MHQLLRDRLTYANVMSTIAVVLVLTGGTAYAATKLINGATIARGTVRAPQLAANSVDSTKVRNRSLRAIDFQLGQLPTGAAGAAGVAGPAGPTGATGPAGSPDTSQFFDKSASDARFAKVDPRVVHVSGAGAATANGAALLAAIATVTPPSSSADPIVIVLGPGTFDLGTQTLTMIDHVSITGSGTSTSIVRGSGSQLVVGATAELSRLTLVHDISTGGTYTLLTLGADQIRLTQADLQTTSSGGGTRTGVQMTTAAGFLVLRDSRISIQGGVTDTGIVTNNTTINAYSSMIDVGGTGTTTGVRLQGSGGLVALNARVQAISGTSKIAIGYGGTGAPPARFGLSQIAGQLEAGPAYTCGASLSSAAIPYAELDEDCAIIP